jgi:hypothetical protein
MRPAVLSISGERLNGPIRNTVLAHAGYAVIPALTAKSALTILRRRHVCVMVIASSISREDQQLLCSEARKRDVACVILDPYGELNGRRPELHFNPLDGPEALLQVISAAMRRDHRPCIG